mmetsp:Transcript_15318/g.40429  ORF Transcript_15318/g.40429 Transcript_15318/m.40429 type:complete len:263 (-) Transcript_15318:9-797(-)
MPRHRMMCAAWYAVGASALSSPWFDLAPPSAPERISTLAEARPPHRKIATIKQRGDDGFAVSVDGRDELRFQRVEAAWAASLGAALWPSSLALAGLVDKFVAERSVLELGSGLGLGGAAAAQAGASKVVCTDMDDELVAMLGEGAHRLDWCDEDTFLGEKFDCVIGADVAYEVSVVPDLVRATLAHVADDGVALIVGERKRPAMRALLDALPADQVRALDYDMERVVLADPPPPPENFGIAVLAYAPSRAALEGLLACLGSS